MDRIEQLMKKSKTPHPRTWHHPGYPDGPVACLLRRPQRRLNRRAQTSADGVAEHRRCGARPRGRRRGSRRSGEPGPAIGTGTGHYQHRQRFADADADDDGHGIAVANTNANANANPDGNPDGGGYPSADAHHPGWPQQRRLHRRFPPPPLCRPPRQLLPAPLQVPAHPPTSTSNVKTRSRPSNPAEYQQYYTVLGSAEGWLAYYISGEGPQAQSLHGRNAWYGVARLQDNGRYLNDYGQLWSAVYNWKFQTARSRTASTPPCRKPWTKSSPQGHPGPAPDAAVGAGPATPAGSGAP
ncbi:hypothetical protein QEH68_20995 [Paenarthrobacter sp. OM7]|uniref:Uncharacterized protein n=1 Tax=Paenarthrobacter sp. AMU7 TaxID=3162492 RepID=A0AB39YP88_9MICC|nr:hypothetical protein [Paenarthrobacter sp. OM7]WGM20460.1 hypothetical protein QEH68_20995 [Paenarthrobacter sp. OM7]